MSDHAVRTVELRRDFGAVRALDGLSLDVSKGAILTLLGPNGAGKTTLLRILMGLIEPTGGQAFVLGAPARSQPACVAGRVAYVGDRCEPPTWATPALLEGVQAGASRTFDRTLFREFCKRRGLSPKRPYGALSKGQRRWVLTSLARMVRITASGHVVYRAEKDHCQKFPEPASEDLFPGVRQNFQIFEPLDFLAELTQHIPNKGEHLIRYYGHYSNKARGMRSRNAPESRSMGIPRSTGILPVSPTGVLGLRSLGEAGPPVKNPAPRPPDPSPSKGEDGPSGPGEGDPDRLARRRWAMLIRRVYNADPLLCPRSRRRGQKGAGCSGSPACAAPVSLRSTGAAHAEERTTMAMADYNCR